MYSQLLLFYFTGTGNALAVCNWIAQIARQNNVPVEIIKITPSLNVKEAKIKENSLIGICYPTHGFNAPPVVVDFVMRFPKSNNQIFLVNTRAGMKLYKWFTPGMSGLAQLLPAFILRTKGYKIIGWQPMDLPSNWISIHPGLRMKVIKSIFERCERITRSFAVKMLNGEKIYKGLISLPIDLLISPISLAYYFFGRFALAKTFVADKSCTLCRRCEKECPVKAIQIINNRPFWTRKCESCMHCMNNCPEQAIQTPHLFVVIIWWLVFFVFPVFLIETFAFQGSFLSNNISFFTWIFILVTGLPVIFFSYRILHFLLRFRVFSWFITFSSLTKLKFWRRYKAPIKF